MTDKEIEFYGDQIYYETMIEFLQNHIDKLKKENEELQKKITELEKEIDELKWREECEIMAGEEYE